MHFRLVLLTLVLATLSLRAAEPEAKPDPAPPIKPAPIYQPQTIEGWKVNVNELLLKNEKAETEKALELLTAQLKEIVRVVPAPALAELRKIPLWFNPAYPAVIPRAEYHPSVDWLKSQKRNPDMAKGVEFTNVAIFEAEARRMPCFVLHELSHGYHDLVLGFEQAEIIAAYKKAVEGKSYESVSRWHGNGRTTTERAYALTNHKEYFAESSEAFFGRNDFFPFTREELEKHDPEMFKLLQKLWSEPPRGAAK